MEIYNIVRTYAAKIESHVVNHYKSLFNQSTILQDNGLVEETIPTLVSEHANYVLTLFPSPFEIKEAVMNLKRGNAPSPDAFGARFYHLYWDITCWDVTRIVTYSSRMTGSYPTIIPLH